MNRNKLPLLLAGALLAAPAAWSQAPAWQSAAACSAASNVVNVAATAADAAGNVYVAGDFQGTATWGSTSLTSAGARDAFVAKWSAATGQFVWVRPLGGTAGDRAYALAVSSAGVYVAGYFSGTASFGGTSLTSAGTIDVFVAKLTDAGSSSTVAWAQRAGGANDEAVRSLAVSGSSIYMAGSYLDSSTFGTTTLTNAGFNDVFVAKLTDAGSSATWAWAQRAGSTGDDQAFAVAVSGGSVYVGGNFDAPNLTFGSSTVTNGGSYDGFVAKLADAGSSAAWNWAQSFGSTSDDITFSLAAAGTSVYVGGYFSTSATFGSTTLASVGNRNGFVAKLVDAGSSASSGWAQRLSSVGGYTAVTGVAVSGAGVYVAGGFGTLGSAPTGTLVVGSTTLTSAGGIDVFVARLTDAGSTGNATWAQRAGGPDNDTGQAVAVAGTGVYVGGNFVSASIAFGSTTLTNPSTGAQAGFVAALTDQALPTRMAGQPALPAYPNPVAAGTVLHLPACPAGATALHLRNATGQLVAVLPLSEVAATVALPATLPPGRYVAEVLAAGQVVRQLLLVE